MAEAGEVTVATFLITGEWFTKHARDRVFEYGWPQAVSFVNDSIPEMSHADLVALLSGKKRVTGNSRKGMELEDEEPAVRAEVEKTYQWHYAGVWYDRPHKVYFRPYARVTGWGQADMARRELPNKYQGEPRGPLVTRLAGGDPDGWVIYRSLHYANDRVQDRAERVRMPDGDEQIVLWEPCPAPPLWVKHFNAAEDALADWCRAFGTTPEERGSHVDAAKKRAGLLQDGRDGGPDELVLPKRLGGEEGSRTPDVEVMTQNSLRRLIPAGTPKHVADGLMRVFEGDAEPELVPTSDARDTNYAWMDREARLWPCRGYMDHIPVAMALVEKFKIDTSRWNGNDEHALENLGWVKLGHDAQSEPFVYALKRANEAQVRVIVDWLITHQAGPEKVQEWVSQLP